MKPHIERPRQILARLRLEEGTREKIGSLPKVMRAHLENSAIFWDEEVAHMLSTDRNIVSLSRARGIGRATLARLFSTWGVTPPPTSNQLPPIHPRRTCPTCGHTIKLPSAWKRPPEEV